MKNVKLVIAVMAHKDLNWTKGGVMVSEDCGRQLEAMHDVKGADGWYWVVTESVVPSR